MSDCRTEEGIMVGLLDGMIAQARIVAKYLRGHSAWDSPEVREALADLRSDEDIRMLWCGDG